MREILFKGYSIETKEWVCGGCYSTKDPETGVMSYFIVEDESQEHIECFPESISQWTGVAIDGRNLYEGDIVQVGVKGKEDKALFVVAFGQCGVRLFGAGVTTEKRTANKHRLFKRKFVTKCSANNESELGYMGFYFEPLNDLAKALLFLGVADDIFGIVNGALSVEIIGPAFDIIQSKETNIDRWTELQHDLMNWFNAKKED